MPPHFKTPTKSEILGAKRILDYIAEQPNPEECLKHKLLTVAKCYGTSKKVSIISRDKHERRTFGEDEKRGGYRGDDILRLSKENISDTVAVIEKNDYEGHDLDYGSLRYEAQLPDVSDRTIRRGLREQENIGRYIARTEEELSEGHAEISEDFVVESLDKRPDSTDWSNVFFSDEFYFGQGQEENRHYIFRRIPKKKERKRGPKRDENPRKDEETKDVHFFALIGRNYKRFIKYTPTNSNGKMSSKQYINEFLKPVVLPLLNEFPDLVLEEDRDGSHTSKLTTNYKKENGISYSINARSSPDLSAVETIANISKNAFRKRARYSREDVREEALRSFENITFEQINNVIDSMPARMYAVIDNRGQKTQY